MFLNRFKCKCFWIDSNAKVLNYSNINVLEKFKCKWKCFKEKQINYPPSPEYDKQLKEQIGQLQQSLYELSVKSLMMTGYYIPLTCSSTSMDLCTVWHAAQPYVCQSIKYCTRTIPIIFLNSGPTALPLWQKHKAMYFVSNNCMWECLI